MQLKIYSLSEKQSGHLETAAITWEHAHRGCASGQGTHSKQGNGRGRTPLGTAPNFHTHILGSVIGSIPVQAVDKVPPTSTPGLMFTQKTKSVLEQSEEICKL